MALARLVALKNLQQTAHRSWGSRLLCRLSSSIPAAEQEKPSAAGEVAVAVTDGSGGKKSKLFPRRTRDYVPAIWDIVPNNGLGSALLEAREKINRLTELMKPWNLLGMQAKENDNVYKLRYQMPGLAKEDVKLTVEDGVLNIRGEHKVLEEEEEGSGDDYWSARSYGYYSTSVLLPDDAKVDEIKAEMKDGVLNIVVPKSERANKDVKEVEVL